MSTGRADTRPGNLIFRSGLRPELIAVPSGSYVSSFSFGSGATVLASYNTVEFPSGTTLSVNSHPYQTSTYCEYRRQDDMVVFSLNMDLNATLAAPTATILIPGSELRIRVLNPITSVIGGATTIPAPPNQLSRGWPVASSNYLAPRLEFTQIYATQATGNWQPVGLPATIPTTVSTGTGLKLSSRLLSDDTIALFWEVPEQVNTTGGLTQIPFEIPLTVGNVASQFNTSNASGSALRLVINAQYICA